MESLSAMRENPLTYNVMLSELHKISVGSNGEAVVVCEPGLNLIQAVPNLQYSVSPKHLHASQEIVF